MIGGNVGERRLSQAGRSAQHENFEFGPSELVQFVIFGQKLGLVFVLELGLGIESVFRFLFFLRLCFEHARRPKFQPFQNRPVDILVR